jgi:hypothetical protein
VFAFFLRAPNGTLTTFDNLPGVIGGFVQPNTFPIMGINPLGVITGSYPDANPNSSSFHGFVRAPNGTITTFDAPGASNQPGIGTQAIAINLAGAITGSFYDASCAALFHGFVRPPTGSLPSSIPRAEARVRPSSALLLCLRLTTPQWPT